MATNTSKDLIIEAAIYYDKFMRVLGLPINADTEETPLRVAKMFHREFSSHLESPPPIKVFDSNGYDEYVVVKNIQFASLCEHHHLPFYGVAHVGYHPNGRVIGLSKIPRIVKHFSSRPQLQERLVMHVAEYLHGELQPHWTMVVADAAHSCMQCRGICDPQSRTITSKIIGHNDPSFDKGEVLALMGVK